MTTPLLIPDSSTAEGVTLLTYRTRLNRELGYTGRGTVTTRAATLEAERYVISSNFRSDGVRPDRYDGLFLYVTGGDQTGTQRMLLDGRFEGPEGAFLVDYPFDAVLEVGDTFEIAVLPALEYQGVSGTNDLINQQGLAALPYLDTIFVTSDGTQRISLIDYSWPIKGIAWVYTPQTTADITQNAALVPTRQRWQYQNDAESPYIQLWYGFSSGDIVPIGVRRPAHTRVRHNGAWGDSTTGLIDDDDQGLYDAETVVRVVLPVALERLGQQYPRGSQERALLMDDAGREKLPSAAAKVLSRFKASGAQRVGAV